MKPIIGIPCGWQEPPEGSTVGTSAIPQSYQEALEAAGAAPLLIPVVEQESTLRALYAAMDGLLLAGGVDIDPAHFGEERHAALGRVDQRRDRVELILTPWALADGMPVLGICRGIQTLNVACGGSLWQDIGAQVPDTVNHRCCPGLPTDFLAHAVHLEPDSRLAEILNRTDLEVNSLHHQAVKALGRGLRVAGRAADGVIEAAEAANGGWVIAVQWHPELLLRSEPPMRRLFEALVAACRAGRGARRG